VALSTADGSATRLHAMLGSGRFVLMSVGVPSPGVLPALQSLVLGATTAAAEGYAVGHHYLVRPDGYLALSTRGSDPSEIVGFLQRLHSTASCCLCGHPRKSTSGAVLQPPQPEGGGGERPGCGRSVLNP
jgi:hypothetical protein